MEEQTRNQGSDLAKMNVKLNLLRIPREALTQKQSPSLCSQPGMVCCAATFGVDDEFRQQQ